MRFVSIKRLTSLLSIVIFLGITTITTYPQSINGSISGVVADQTGAAIAGATVKVKNLGTGAEREIITTEQGIYRITGLPIGTYSLRVEKIGFQSQLIEQVTVSVGADSNINFALGTGPIQEVVTVSDAGALLEATQSQILKTVDNKNIMELPGRNTLNGLALLNPGVLPNQNGRPGSGFVVNGNRTRSNNFTMDGANNNDQSLSIPRQGLPPEAIQEFQMITNTFSAEYGRNAGSYVNVISKSGSNEFHGIGHWTWQGNGLNALSTNQERNFKASVASGQTEYGALRRSRNVTVDNVFGGVIGGPIKRDHTFFFASADFNPVRQTISSVSRRAISASGADLLRSKQADFGFAPGVVDFLFKTFPIANQPTAITNLTVIHRDFQTATVVPADKKITIPIQVFNRTLTQGIAYGTDFQRYLGKISTRINSKDQLSFRYLIDDFDDPGAPASLVGTEIGQKTRNQTFTINDVYAISPSLINESRITYSRRNIRFPENNPSTFTIVSDATNFLSIGNGNFPQFRTDNSYELTDNISYARNKHNWKFGANVMRYDLNSFFAPDIRGTARYGSLQDFLYDKDARLSRYAGEGYVPAKTYELGFFAQDDWRFSSDLTLNLGARYEYVTTPFGFFSNSKSDLNNLAPSIGFAWNPKRFQNGNFVLRGGYRTSFDQVFQNVLLNVSRNFPRAVQVVRQGVTGQAPYNRFPNSPIDAPQPQDFIGNPNLLPLRLFSPNKRYEQPMSMQYNLGIQYQLAKDYIVKIEYIGTKGTHLVREVEANFGFATSASRVNDNTLRTDPTRGSILIGDGIANSIYHSGQITLEKRFSTLSFGSLNFNVNYTYSSFISESDDVLGGQTNRTLPADPRNAKLDRARSGFDQPHRFIASYVYELPKAGRSLSGRTGAIADKLINGWGLSGTTSIAAGTPFSILSGNNQLGILSGQISTVELSQRVSLNPNGIYPLVSVGNSNPNARFILHPAFSGILGTLGANTERTGGLNQTNLALVKRIKTTESQNLNFRWEVTNVFNRRNFIVIPTNTVTANTPTDATFLNLGFTNVTGRSMIFTVRYQF